MRQAPLAHPWQTRAVIVIVAPGQGSQTPGFLEPWLADPAAREQLEAISDAVGIDLVAHGTTSDADTIRDTAVAQPLIVAAGLVTARALLADGRREKVGGDRRPLGRRDHRGGGRRHPERDRRGDVRARARPRDGRAASLEATGMSAVIGGDEDALLARLAELDLSPANFNGGGQIVVAGALRRARAARGEPGRRAPASSRCRSPARSTPATWSPRSPSCGLSPPDSRRTTRASGSGPTRTARRSPSGKHFLDLLVGQVSSPVRWDRVMESFAAAGVTGIIELAPAGALVGLAKRGLKGIPDRRGQDARRPRTPHSTSSMGTHDHATLKQSTGVPFTRIYSYGAARGDLVVPNDDLIGPIDSSDEWIQQRTGIIDAHAGHRPGRASRSTSPTTPRGRRSRSPASRPTRSTS